MTPVMTLISLAAPESTGSHHLAEGEFRKKKFLTGQGFGDTKSCNFTCKVPQTINPGSHYAIFVGTQAIV